jgi:hypothetical protein
MASMLLFSELWGRNPGWRISCAFVIGDIGLILLGLFHGGYTFNLGLSEIVVLYGIIITIGSFVTYGFITKRVEEYILYFGGVAVDLISFYPQAKQYLLPGHDRLSVMSLCGWIGWMIGITISIIFVEEFFRRLRMPAALYQEVYGEEKNRLKICSSSLFSVEQIFFMSAMVFVMTR